MINVLKMYQKLQKWPLGNRIFSAFVCIKAPYFSSISPLVSHLTSNEIIVNVRKKHKVLNHLKTMHVIAIANACELAVGVLMQTGLPKELRWIPKGMNISYLKKAETDIKAIAKVPDWSKITVGDNFVIAEVFDANMNKVVEAQINMWVTLKK
jgi:acyl-coenzyme A thioesterase PaaI-like protein